MKKEVKLNASARKFLARTRLSHNGLLEQKSLKKISSQSVTPTAQGSKSLQKNLYGSFWQQSFNTVKDMKFCEEKNKEIFNEIIKIIQKSVKNTAVFLKDHNLVMKLTILLNKVGPALADKLYFESIIDNIFYWNTSIDLSRYTSILAACNATLKSYSTPPTPIGDVFRLCNNETIEIVSNVSQAQNDPVQRCIAGQLCSSSSSKIEPMAIIILVAVIVFIIGAVVKACCKPVHRINPDGSIDAEPTYQCRC